MAPSETIPPLEILEQRLTETLKENSPSRRDAAIQLADEAGATLQAALRVQADILNWSDDEHRRQRASEFIIEKIHGIGKPEAERNNNITFIIEGEKEGSVRGIINPKRTINVNPEQPTITS